MGEYACDLECTGLLEDMKKQAEPELHNLAFLDINSDESCVFNGSDKAGIQEFLSQGHKLYIHNGVQFDGVVLEWFGYDISKSTIVDTLPISWYLYPDRQKHGLEAYGEEFGVPKPVIEDWNTQTQADYDHRVMEDCKIQKQLWLKQKEKLSRLYEGVDEGGQPKYQRLINYLMWKVEQLKYQAANKVKLDVPAAEALQVELEAAREAKVSQLFLAMPKVPVKAKRTRPAKPFLKNGELSATGLKWDQLTKEKGINFDYTGVIEVVTGYDEPNPASHTQIKDWLYSLGWSPTEFKYDRQDNGDIRKIPQVNLKGGLIAPCVEELVEVCPDIEHLTGLGIINHRLSVVKGFLRDAIDGELSAGASGFTNTLRLKHREIVNLPSSRVLYGKELRGLLVAREGMMFLGSDLSSLENRLLHHYQWNLDRAYVETQLADDYDPHLALGVMAELLTQEDSDWYKLAKKRDDLSSAEQAKYAMLDKARAISKNGNYACLPMQTKVLTADGWKLFDEISVGDLLPTYNEQTGLVEMDTVELKHFFDDKAVMKYSNNLDSFQCTEDHRWLMTKRLWSDRLKQSQPSFVSASTLNTEMNILLTAPYVGGNSNITDDECEFLGWVMSDGYWKWSDKSEATSCAGGTRKGIVASVAQAEHKYWRELESCLDSIEVPYSKRTEVKETEFNVFHYSISSIWMRDFLDRIFGERFNKHEYNWSAWMLTLSQSNLKSFMHSFFLGDGSTKEHERNGCYVLAQNTGNIFDGVVTALQLLGEGRIVVRAEGQKCRTLRRQKRKHLTCQRLNVESLGVQDTFCLTTGNGSFIIWQDDFIGITGNCQYGAGIETLARTAKIPKRVAKQVHKGYNDLNWSVKKIGTMTTVKKIGSESWQYNPISKLWYSLRSDKDRVSTLIQGSGAYIFDIWVFHCMKLAERRGIEYRLLMSMHDEKVVEIQQDTESVYEDITQKAIEKVNQSLKLNRDLACDVQFGSKYSEIH